MRRFSVGGQEVVSQANPTFLLDSLELIISKQSSVVSHLLYISGIEVLAWNTIHIFAKLRYFHNLIASDIDN